MLLLFHPRGGMGGVTEVAVPVLAARPLPDDEEGVLLALALLL